MKYTCEWADEQRTVLVITALPGWTWEDGYQAIAAKTRALKSVSHGVYTIFDFSTSEQSRRIPGGVAGLHVRHLIMARQSNQRLTLFVGMGTLLQALMDMARNAFGLKDIFATYRFVPTMDDALNIIQAHQQHYVNAAPPSFMN